jgi:hypothetical protein
MPTNSNTREPRRIEPGADVLNADVLNTDVANRSMLSAGDSLRFHLPEYLMEAGETGLYLFSACAFATLLWHGFANRATPADRHCSPNVDGSGDGCDGRRHRLQSMPAITS